MNENLVTARSLRLSKPKRLSNQSSPFLAIDATLMCLVSTWRISQWDLIFAPTINFGTLASLTLNAI